MSANYEFTIKLTTALRSLACVEFSPNVKFKYGNPQARTIARRSQRSWHFAYAQIRCEFKEIQNGPKPQQILGLIYCDIDGAKRFWQTIWMEWCIAGNWAAFLWCIAREAKNNGRRHWKFSVLFFFAHRLIVCRKDTQCHCGNSTVSTAMQRDTFQPAHKNQFKKSFSINHRQ